MKRTLAIIFGVAFLLFGILGFIPDITHRGMLFGLFKINLEVNAIHIATGLFAILSGLTSKNAVKIFFIFFGIFYLLWAIVGYQVGDGKIYGMLVNNTPDTWMHATSGIVFLYCGFFLKR